MGLVKDVLYGGIMFGVGYFVGLCSNSKELEDYTRVKERNVAPYSVEGGKIEFDYNRASEIGKRREYIDRPRRVSALEERVK